MRKFVCIAIVASMVIAGRANLARGDELTGQDVVTLKKLGYSDSDIIAAAQKAGTTLHLSDADVQSMKAAGASDELIAALQKLSSKGISPADVLAMQRAGKTAEQIIDAIFAAGGRPMTADQAAQLTRDGVPAAVIVALQAKPLRSADLKTLATGHVPAALREKLARALGYAKEDLAPADALELMKLGVAEDAVAALRTGRAPVPADAVTFRQYRHPADYFLISYPSDWKVIRDVIDGSAKCVLTPQLDVKSSQDATTNISVSLVIPDTTLPMMTRDAVALLKHFIPAMLAEETGIKLTSEVTTAKFAGLSGATVSFKGRTKHDKQDEEGESFLAMDHGVVFAVDCEAPVGHYAAVRPLMMKILEHSRLGKAAVSQRGQVREPNEIAERYKQSVVCILADFGDEKASGTGFIIQHAGYVATNAHVAMDLEHDGRRARSYTAIFDSGLNKKPLPLTFLGARFKPSRFGNYGVDVALFKLPPGEYPAVPLTPQRDVELGDAILTLGFPHSFDFRTVNIFATGGVVTRFNRALDGSVESMFMDAKITHGNSGGPAFSRVTGGVIGLTTYGNPIRMDNTPLAEHLNDLVGYNGLVPTDVYAAEFPLVAELGLNPSSNDLDFADCYALAKLYSGQGRVRASVELARAAVARKPDSADAYYMLGQCLAAGALDEEKQLSDFTPTLSDAISMLEKAQSLQPGHLHSALALANAYSVSDEPEKALAYAQEAAHAHPDEFQAFLALGWIHVILGQDDKALAAADQAKKLTEHVLADAYILKGLLLYRQGKLQEGRAEFMEASHVHPTNLRARMGVAQYFEYKKDWNAALAEYKRIDGDVPGSSLIANAVGQCYARLKQYRPALDAFDDCVSRASDEGKAPPLAAFITGASIISDAMQKPTGALQLYLIALPRYSSPHDEALIHKQMAAIWRDSHRLPIAAAHLRMAASAQPSNAEVRAELSKLTDQRLGLADIQYMLTGIKYPPSIAADLIANSPLDFKVEANTQADVARLVRDQGLPAVVVGAIIRSNRRFPLR